MIIKREATSDAFRLRITSVRITLVLHGVLFIPLSKMELVTTASGCIMMEKRSKARGHWAYLAARVSNRHRRPVDELVYQNPPTVDILILGRKMIYFRMTVAYNTLFSRSNIQYI